jgi:hypothetical protein
MCVTDQNIFGIESLLKKNCKAVFIDEMNDFVHRLEPLAPI